MYLNKILITDEVNDSVIVGLRALGLKVDICTDKQQIFDIIKNYDAILVRIRTLVTRELIEAGTKLKLIARFGNGVDNIDVAAASRRDILVMNCPDGTTVSTCELTCAHILNTSRQMCLASATLKRGLWSRVNFVGFELSGKTLGIIGLGRIGAEVATRMKSFEMTVVAYSGPNKSVEMSTPKVELVPLEDIWRRADIITLHVPLTQQTKHMINRETLSKCKRGVIIINVGRGGLVDEAALLEGLNSGQVRGAGLDVFEVEPSTNEELIRHPNVSVTPHIGASTYECRDRVCKEIVENFRSLKEGRRPAGGVNEHQLLGRRYDAM